MLRTKFHTHAEPQAKAKSLLLWTAPNNSCFTFLETHPLPLAPYAFMAQCLISQAQRQLLFTAAVFIGSKLSLTI
jgi:hypothetical protein